MNITEQYRNRLKTFVEKKFFGFDFGIREIYPRGFTFPGHAIDFVYKGVDCLFGFYNKDGKLVFRMEMESPRKEGLADKISQQSPSGNSIDESSKYLSRPSREAVLVGDSLNIRNFQYAIECKMKPNLPNLDSQQNPEITDIIIKEIWNYIIKTPLGLSTGLIK
jgi:hypothetical protein